MSAISTKRRRLGVALVAIAAVGAWGLSLRAPFGRSEGTLNVAPIVASVAATEPAKLRLGTYNIHGGKGTDGRLDLDRIAAVLQGLDFAGLNEVHGDAPWQAEDQAMLLGKQLNLTPFYAPTEQRWRCLEFGNGFLTRLPVEKWLVEPMPREHGKSFRNYVRVWTHAANGRRVNILLTHIDRSDDRERREQLRIAGERFLAMEMPAVFMGDLNSDATEPALRSVIEAGGVIDVLREKFGDAAPRHIDWIFVRGARVLDAGITDPGPSDHPHVWAELEIPPAPPSAP